jgi:hypothetical protein
MTIRTTDAVRQEYDKILRYLHDHPHTTVQDIATDVFGDASPKGKLKVARRLDDLRDQKLIGRFTSDLFVGYRSPYSYHLTRKGMQVLGVEKRAASHLHKPSSKHFRHLQTKLEIARWAAANNWLLATQSQTCKQYLFRYSMYVRSLMHGETQEWEEAQEREKTYPSWLLLPAKILSDYVLATEYDCIIIVVTHPGANGSIVRSRIAKYQSVLRYAKLLVVTQSDFEYLNCRYVLEDQAFQSSKDKVCIVKAAQLPELTTIIHASAACFIDAPHGRKVSCDWREKNGTAPKVPFAP